MARVLPGRCTRSVLASLLVLLGASLRAQIVNPADKQRPPDSSPASQDPDRRLSADRPPVIVEGQRPSELHEEERIGSYGQPRWTAKRRFSETRLYVIPEGQAEFEYWLLPEFPRHGGKVKTATQYEFEFGLPNRFQFDLYGVTHKEGNEGPMAFDQAKFEVRWALADWDKIWGNPTIYLEWAANDNAPDAVEAKLLFGGEVCPRLHWGANLVFEHQTGGEMENSQELTLGTSYTISDSKFSIGVEGKFAFIDKHGHRGNFDHEFLIGPSIQYRPLPRAHIDFAPLFGITNDAPEAKVFFIFGWEF